MYYGMCLSWFTLWGKGGTGSPASRLLMSIIRAGHTQDSPRSSLTVTPDSPVFTGETVNLKCVIETYSDWRYVWYKGCRCSVMLKTSDRYTVNGDTLTIRGVITSDQDRYRCRGRRDGETNSSQWSSVSLSVKDKPKPTLTVKPQSSVFTGDTVTLSCDVGQLTGWTIHWRKDSDPESTTDATKTIKSVRASDEGEYRCRARRGNYYSEFSNTVKITVTMRPKPVVGVDPDRRVFRGETVTLTCDIQQTGVWQYSWYKDNKQDYIIGRDQNYKIPSVDPSHRGVYRCRGTQIQAPTHTQMSDGVTLTVSDSPRSSLTVTPDSPVFTGETVNLKCVIESHSNWRYEWYKDTDSIMLQTSDRYTVNRDTLTIRGVITSDQGQYWCRGQIRSVSSQSNSVSLSVKVRPKPVVGVDPDRRVFRGETVTLTCDIQQTGVWQYSWYKDYKQDYIIGRDQNYKIPSVDPSHRGVYSCRGTQTQAPTHTQMSDGVTLIVSGETVHFSLHHLKTNRLNSPRSSLTVTPDSPVFTGETVNLKCVIGSQSYRRWRIDQTHKLKYEWYKDGVMLQTSDGYTVNRDTLTIRGVITSDQGQYWCRGQIRSVSSQSNSVSLSVKDSPRSSLTVTPDSPVFTGETVNLKCVIESHSNWTYEWYKDTDSVLLQTSDRYTVNRDTLTIRGVITSDQGQYWCRGQIRSVSSQSNSVSLSVKGELNITVLINSLHYMNTHHVQHFSSTTKTVILQI
ncbi:basement membrane-specific heparan sulfate proteoglycan core protein-like [Carassius carassius]|uniref:basement membrane-specific heparan sulfate proteoglycan core protein-like n=1 Tax=Carassius carassius TaxID=217509 RepID=UPI0028695A0D|nr:basement membrane-specific heparan sulfate proteoglycan core protein-like [Carassius carassius]